ncbi:putative SNF2 family helicase/ATPase [Aspergillus ibericus CBS 121593]|uniref:SNF2 family helicase/ATPase n=1 Tax=Aspergillus ibericus CBS 121593 TaxID=1448316 RepID=A0A395HDG9_9EURO|nr:hypothetical protein BO80DRAFT_420748 [Aspergillus ibericus CBS 121593]RAL05549.1 hypothetical protein BO80DRAFT_420748 [Aspergillus ibericus CBS 121593]
MSLGEDPIDWTVDEVVQFLCRNPETPWARSSSRAPRPNPVTFEATLRENEVTGEVLLHDVDKETLRDDLGLRALGHRSSMLMAIRYLQRNSPKFQDSRTLLSVPHEDQYSSAAPVFPQFNSPSYHIPLSHDVTPQRKAFQNPRLQTPTAPRGALLGASANEQRSGTADDRRSDGTASHHDVTDQNEGRKADSEPKSPERRTRPGEDMVVDGQGRKRRKLNLSALNQDSNNDLAPRQESRPQTAKEWYMGPDELNVSQLFYASDSDENDQEFTMVSSRFPTAQRKFVNKSLGYSYKQRPVKLNANQSALVPYQQLTKQTSKPSKKPLTIDASKPKYCTLFTVSNGNVTVTKDELHKWPQLLRSEAAESEKNADPYDYLLHRYPAQDDDDPDTYPLYGDSGSEGEFDEETWQEIENERREPLPQQRTLTSAEVNSIIDSCVAEFENDWLQHGKAKEEPKARRIWLAARRGKCTNEQIKNLTRDISLLDRRLGVFTKAIREGEYNTSKELQTQCRSLENTVTNIQKQKWRISILEQEQCPPKISAPARPLPPRRQGTDEDGESLASDSDGASTGSLDDFIDNSDVLHASSTPSSSDDDIISPSGARRKFRNRSVTARGHPFVESSSPSPAPVFEAPVECIDLTRDSPLPEDDEFRVETPPLNPPQPRTPQSEHVMSRDISPAPSLPLSVYVEIPPIKREQPSRPHEEDHSKSRKERSASLPDISDIDRLKETPWRMLWEHQDRRRLLAKLIIGLADEERKRLIGKIPRYDVFDLQHLTLAALKQLTKKRDTMPDMEPLEASLILRTASLFVSWINCTHYRMAKGLPRKDVKRARSEITGFPEFYKELCACLDAYHIWQRNKQGESQETQSALGDTPHKKRKREVKESQTAKTTQETAQLRVAVQESLRQKLERKLESMGVSNTDATRQAVSFGNPVIYLDPHIGQRVKPHQLHGVQFMWRELIEDETHQGCLLAHTMGLGKTMQVISLIVTIANAAASEDPEIRQKVPKELLRSQTLILCPSSLIENWYEEFLMWTPKDSAVGPVNKVTSSASHPERMDTLARWNEEGGVLLISYDMFRTWVFNKETTKRPKPLSDEEHQNIKKWLLEGARLIVADEAHKMKNPSSAITAAAMQFRSQSRIALTGSPLANNLVDYFTMVNWIAKGYLGEFLEFKANFLEPIEEGLYVDSTYTERRRSLVKLQVLNTILDPKINRADISVLAGSLPPKVEFVITVPLTDVQKAAYNLYVESVLRGTSDVSRVQLMSWLAILGLCCNHPTCFRDKLMSRANDAQRLDKTIEGVEPAPGDEPITQLGLDVDSLVAEQERLFSAVPDMKAPVLSCRAQILDRIVAESVRAGDKVLVFSHSIPTLNYVEHLLRKSGWKYCRLDGQTPIASRQAATKQFNQGSAENVYLISTRAGGLGLNIFGANRVILFDFSFSPIWEEQAVGRAYRMGQNKPVFVYRFIAGGTFEENMYNKALFKTQLAFRVVDKKNPVRSAAKSLGDYLFPAKEVPETDVTAFLGKDPEVLDKIIRSDADASERLIRKITLTETFQKDDNDKLTEEERNAAQQQLSDERLKRTDPEAYQRLVIERQRALLAQNSLSHQTGPYMSPSSALALYPPQYPAQPPRPYYSRPPQTPAPQPTVPASAHNVGPPALAPDTSVMQSTPAADEQPPLTIPGLGMLPRTHPHAQSEPVTPITNVNFRSVPGSIPTGVPAPSAPAQDYHSPTTLEHQESTSTARGQAEPPQSSEESNKNASCRPQ